MPVSTLPTSLAETIKTHMTLSPRLWPVKVRVTALQRTKLGWVAAKTHPKEATWVGTPGVHPGPA